MKKIVACLLSLLGLSSACGQKNFVSVDVGQFAALVVCEEGADSLKSEAGVVVLDVRTAEEYRDGHIANAVNIDINQSDFLEKAKATLPEGKTVAVYCRSGKRSANAAGKLAAESFRVVNLSGGITAWKAAGMPVTTEE